jgi:hypothetical protein
MEGVQLLCHWHWMSADLRLTQGPYANAQPRMLVMRIVSAATWAAGSKRKALESFCQACCSTIIMKLLLGLGNVGLIAIHAVHFHML